MKSDCQDPAQDPRLTAYALGELTEPKEIEEVEGLLRGSAALRREVESLRATAELLQVELEKEPCPSLAPRQLASLREPPRTWTFWPRVRPGNRSRWFPAGLATAAAVAVMVSAAILFLQETEETHISARLQQPEPVLAEAPADMGSVTNQAQDRGSPGPGAAAPPQSLVETAPEPSKTASPGPPAVQDSSGSSLPAALATADSPTASPSGPVQSNEQELSPPSRAEHVGEAYVETSHKLPSGSWVPRTRAEHVGEAYVETAPPAALVDPGSESDRPSISYAGARVIQPPAQPEGRVLEAPEIPGARVVESQVLPGGIVREQYARRGRSRMPQSVVPFSPTVDVRANLDELPAAPSPVPSRSSTEDYRYQEENPFRKVVREPLSTFGIDVDTASYANVRRFLRQGSLPPRDAVRIEEMVNYFSYAYGAPKGEDPVSVLMDMAPVPWRQEHLLLRIGIQAQAIDPAGRPPSNLVFLLDVSGSMRPANKLPLLKRAIRLLIKNLGEKDRVAFVTYAGESEVVLPSTPCDRKEEIFRALEHIMAGGPTNGEAGILEAYATAAAHFIQGGTNRVILATDGDFNLGLTDEGSLVRLIREQARSGVFLSVLGLGTGNYKDASLESLANRGNGNFAYLDSLAEARKVLVREMGATLVTVAKDAKIQVEFNPARVDSYRLLGYENRALRHEEFNDDSRDGGEIGAGQQVTVLYEIVPAGTASPAGGVDPLKYQTPPAPNRAGDAHEWLTLKIRYKPPDRDESRLLEFTHRGSPSTFTDAAPDFRFASAVAAFGMILRDSPHRGTASLQRLLRWTLDSTGDDLQGPRAEFVELVAKAMALER